MERSTIIERQIVNVINEVMKQARIPVKLAMIRVYRATFYNLKKKYSGADSYKLKRLKKLEDENRKLKHVYTELIPDQKMLKRVRRIYSAD